MTQTLTQDDLNAIAASVWDEVLTAATHNVLRSAGRRLRNTADSTISSDVLPSQAGMTINQVKLAASEPATDHVFTQDLIVITDGTGIGQTRLIVEYSGATKVATVNCDWDVAPAAAAGYTVLGFSSFLFTTHGIARAGTLGR